MDQQQLERVAAQLAEMLDLKRKSKPKSKQEAPATSVTAAVKEFHKAAAKGNRQQCAAFVENGGDANARGKKGLTALHIAANAGHSRVVRELLRLGARLEAQDDDGDTPLVLAILGKDEDMVRLLLDAGASLQHKNKAGHTPADVALHKQKVGIVELLQSVQPCLQFNSEMHHKSVGLAAQEGHRDVVEYWLQHNPDRGAVDHRYGAERTLAFIASLNGHLGIVQLLDRHGADFEIADRREHTPLFCATQNGHLEIVKFLVRTKKCNVNHESVTKRTAIFSACANGHIEVVRLLLRHGANAAHKDEEGTTPVECAVRGDYLPIVDLLAASGADLLVSDERGYDMVMTAAIAKRVAMLKELRSRGVPCDRVNPKNKETALLAACQVGPEEAVQFLLEAGSDRNHQNRHGVSPALRAAYNGLPAVLRTLGDAGAQLDLRNKSNETAALCAAQKDSLEMVQYLHGKGCSMATKDNSGKTLAWYAAKKGNVELLRFLRDRGAPLDEPDEDGNTPLMLAVQEANAAAVRLLADAGADGGRKNQQGDSANSLARKHGRSEVLDALSLRGGNGRRSPSPDRRQQQQQQQQPQQQPQRRQEQQQPEPQHIGARARLDADFQKWQIIYEGTSNKAIGEGGFGKVYKAYTDKHQFVAVKIVKTQHVNEKMYQRAVEAEKRGVEMLRSVNHPNIVSFLKTEQNRKGFCIFTELISGIDLRQLMLKQKKPFNEDGVKKFALQICHALNHLHTRKPAILHRDIKCSNIMLTHEGVIKLIDFGLAKEIVNTSVVYTTAHACGTAYFMAPELYNEDTAHVAYTPKSDVWAFGCSVFEMATQEPPNVQCKNPLRLHRLVCDQPMPQLPGSFSADAHSFHGRCLEKSPVDRADADELLAHPFLKDQ